MCAKCFYVVVSSYFFMIVTQGRNCFVNLISLRSAFRDVLRFNFRCAITSNEAMQSVILSVPSINTITCTGVLFEVLSTHIGLPVVKTVNTQPFAFLVTLTFSYIVH